MRLGLLQPIEQTIAVALFRELCPVNPPFSFEHVTLEPLEEVIRGVIEQLGLGL
jgi:hypothetical protein